VFENQLCPSTGECNLGVSLKESMCRGVFLCSKLFGVSHQEEKGPKMSAGEQVGVLLCWGITPSQRDSKVGVWFSRVSGCLRVLFSGMCSPDQRRGSIRDKVRLTAGTETLPQGRNGAIWGVDERFECKSVRIGVESPTAYRDSPSELPLQLYLALDVGTWKKNGSSLSWRKTNMPFFSGLSVCLFVFLFHEGVALARDPQISGKVGGSRVCISQVLYA
jgi:hypothetical protein